MLYLMRKYQPIWEAIKATKKASLVAAPEDHDKIIAMVKKEKQHDLAFKLECSLANVTYRLKIRSEYRKELLHFKLVKDYTPKIENL